MKVVATKRFRDKKENTLREIGDVFVVSKARYTEINTALPGYIEEVKEESELTETDQDTKPKE